MTLRQQQTLFTLCVAKLIIRAYEMGFELTLGEAWRPPEMAKLNAQSGKGIANSLHGDRLAIDLNLFKDGAFLSRSEDHKPLADYWKTLHPLCCWGGDFKPNADGNHYSMTFGGRK
jgi:hypothetical protein